MTADCKLKGKSYEGDSLPIFRGTYGLWKHYPALKEQLITFDEFIKEDFFKENPSVFWYVWGDIFRRQKLAKPHTGYQKLSEIIDLAEKREKYFVYHSGVDKMYLRSNNDVNCNFAADRYVQIKGSVVDWQCKSCEHIQHDCDQLKQLPVLEIDLIGGLARKKPYCWKCGKLVRPNINLRSDLGWLEDDTADQLRRLDKFFKSKDVYKRSMTVLEIGAGPVQPLARHMGEKLFKNDKYRCALIRINPVKERDSQYKDEREYFLELVRRQRQQYFIGSSSENTANFEVRNKLEDDNRYIVQEEEK